MNRLQQTELSIAVIAYCLYCLQGCPLGDNLAGFQVWIKMILIERLIERCKDGKLDNH